MPHNPRALPGREFALPDHRILALEGPDAVAFAHAQFMNDVAGLDVGRWQWNGWLTPRGRLVALFALLKLDAQALWLLLPDAEPVELATSLQRFVFRSKVKLEPRLDLAVTGFFSSPAESVAAAIAGDPDAGAELDMGAAGGARSLRIAAGRDAESPPDGSVRWAAFDIEHGLPRLPPSQSGQWTPQQLSLDRLRAFSVRKGCYPGQEIVARTHFLGQAKRGLALLEADAPLAPGDEVGDGTRAIGTLVSVSRNDAGSTALAVLPLERGAASTLSVGNVALRERALLDGLAR